MSGPASWTPCPYCFEPSASGAAFCASCGKPLRGADTVAPVTAAMPTTPIPSTPAPAPPIATTVSPPQLLAGRYRITTLLGRGSFGEVFRGIDERTGERVAVKLLTMLRQATAPDREAALRWFRREVKALGWLSHPGIVARRDAGEEDGIPFLVMELVEGETLADRLAREGRLPFDDGVDVLKQLLDALAYAHAAGVVHRDLKPANLLIDGRGIVKVSDFGLAKLDASLAPSLSATGSVIGTPFYMSPEQAAGRPADRRSDTWSVGVIAYEIFTGKRPFDGTVATCMYRIIHETPLAASAVLPTLPGGIDAFCRQALEKSPELRFAGAEEMRATLLSVTRRADTEELPAFGAARSAGKSTREMNVPRELARRRPRLNVERVLLWSSIPVLGAAAFYATYLVRSRPQPQAAVAGAHPIESDGPISVKAPPGATVLVDGHALLPAMLPGPGKHVVTVLVPGSAPLRRTIDVASDRASFAIDATAQPAVAAGATIPEELTLLGTIATGGKPLALFSDRKGRRAWLAIGERAGDGRVTKIERDAATLSVPLSAPETGEVPLRVAACDAAPGQRTTIGVQSEPTGAEVKLGPSGPTVGLTPFSLTIERGRPVTLLVRSKGRQALLSDLDADRLLTMQELYVVLP